TRFKCVWSSDVCSSHLHTHTHTHTQTHRHRHRHTDTLTHTHTHTNTHTVWTSLWTSTMGLVWGIVAVYLVKTASPPWFQPMGSITFRHSEFSWKLRFAADVSECRYSV